MQADLNRLVAEKQDLKDSDGNRIDFTKLSGDGPNSDVNTWLNKFLTALDDESRELREELLWKWWSKDKLDMQNIKVELIDILHFWISLCQVAGMTADDVASIYKQKYEVNIARQMQAYSKLNKDEADNKGIK